MNPAIAKLTPWIIEVFSESLAESGMIVGEVTVNALTSWTQFFKNIPMALIAFVLIYASIFTKEYEDKTLELILTKGIKRYKIVLSKLLLLICLWTLGYWICFMITYLYTGYFWDNSIATGLVGASFNWWLFGLFVLCLVVFFSTLFNNYSTVLLGSGGVVVAMSVVSFIPKIATFMPTSLMNSSLLLIGSEALVDYIEATFIALTLMICSIVFSIVLFNKKQI